MENDKTRTQVAALKWLYELELFENPQVINQMKLNVLAVSSMLEDVEFLIYREKKSCLVSIHYKWWAKFFNKKQIKLDIEEIMSHLLPEYRFRVTDNPAIIKMSIQNLKNALRGGRDAVRNISPNSNDGSNSNPVEHPEPHPTPTVESVGTTGNSSDTKE
jgi:hypothetical protein